MKRIITAATITLLFLFSAATSTSTVAKGAKSLKSADEFFKKWCYGDKPNAPLEIKAICSLKRKIDDLYAGGDGDWTVVGDDMYSAVSGNVGIGITAPSVKLEVDGKVKMEEFQLGTSTTAGYILTADSSGVGTWQEAPSVELPSGTTGQTLRHDGTDWTATSNLYNDGSKVGIGITNPGWPLHVYASSTEAIYGVAYGGIAAIIGESYASTGYGVLGLASGSNGVGVYGYTDTGGATSEGVRGIVKME